MPPTKRTAAAPARKLLSDQLRRAALDHGTAYAVARAAGLNPTIVHRFMTGERSLSLDTADKIADALGLRLVETGRAKPARK